MSPRLVLSALAAALIAVHSVGLAQLPERRLPPPGAKPGVVTPPRVETLDPKVGALDPGAETPAPVTEALDPKIGTLDPSAAPPPAVRPGTVLQRPAAPPSRELVYLAPGEVPASVRVVTTGPRSVTLQWSPTTGAHAYWVHQAQGGTYYRGGQSTTETTLTVTRLLPGTVHSFKVSATYPQEMQRREGISEAVSARTELAPAPTGLKASVVGRGQVSLTWDGLPGADGFRLYRNGAVLSDMKPITQTLGGPAILRTTFGDSVPPGAYLYQIQAVYRAVGTAGAEAVSALAPTPPVGVTFKTFRYCQTRVGSASCAEPDPASVTILAASSRRAAGRNSP